MDNLNFTSTIHYALGLCAFFTGVFMFFCAINHFLVEPLRQRRQIAQRLRGNKREEEVRAQIFKVFKEQKESKVVSFVEQLTGWGRIENLQRQMLQADIYLNPGAFLSIIGIMGLAGFTPGMMMGKLSFGVMAGLFMGALPLLFLRWKRRRKTLQFEKQMPDAMELLARSVRAGHTLAGTLELVSQEVAAPLGTEMRITYEEQRLGLSVAAALRRMGERVASRDLHYFVTAVLIQTESGGNLAEVLENIGQIIRERLKLKGKVRGLTAEGRFSAIILGLLPLVTFIALFLINKEYARILLTDPLGFKLLMSGGFSILMGALVMKRMVNIKV